MKMEKIKKKEYQKDKYTQISSFKELRYTLSGLVKFFEIVSPFILLEYLIEKLKNT
jgi:hypothetical protein